MKKMVSMAFNAARDGFAIDCAFVVLELTQIQDCLTLFLVDTSELRFELTRIANKTQSLAQSIGFIDKTHVLKKLQDIEVDFSDFSYSLDQVFEANDCQNTNAILARVLGLDRYLLGLLPADIDSDTSGSSVRSLGTFLSDADKSVLYTYSWGCSDWSRGSDFRSWVESSERLPDIGATLNCWEAAIVILNTLGLLAKTEIQDAFVRGKNGQMSDGATCAYETDAEVVTGLLGLWDISCAGDCNDIHPGDIVIFDTQWTEMAHVAIALEQTSKTWLLSFWTSPQEKMIKVTENRLIRAFNATQPPESLSVDSIRVSTKFREKALRVAS
jgi:hypothetical protein